MSISHKMNEFAQKSSWIRKMFEQGARLKQEFGAENVFDFSLGNPDLLPPQQFYDRLRDLANQSGPGFHGYMPNAGYPDVRRKIAKQVAGEQGIDLSENEILMTCGAAGGLNVVL